MKGFIRGRVTKEHPCSVSLTDVAKISDEVYMEVVVGGEEAGNHQRSFDSTSLSKEFMPVAWAAACG